MTTPEKSELHTKYETYPPEIQKVITLIACAFLGAHQELDTKGYNEEGKNPGILWEWLNTFCEKLIEEDPKTAFNTAIALLECPNDLKSTQNPEKLRYWVQATGIQIVSLPKMQSFLMEEVNNDSSVIYPHIQEALEFSTEGWTKKQCMEEPRSYNRFAAVAVGINLRNSKPGTKAHELFQMANALRNDPQYEQQIKNFYWGISDCKDTVRLIYIDSPRNWITPPITPAETKQ